MANTLQNINIYNPPASMLEGYIEKNIPESLKKIIPSKIFLKP